MDKDLLAKAVYKKMMATDYCSQWMGIEPVEIKHNYCKIKMVVKKEMLNGYGILHGGIAFSFADSAFAFASNSEGRVAVSINGTMDFHGSAMVDDELIAIAELIHSTHKTAVYDVNLLNSENKRLYSFRGTVYRKKEEIL